ncbi:hypothetical protein D3C76_1276890 [compost metagenome]
MVVGEDNLHAVLCHAAAELVEIGDHHVGRQGQTGALVQLGHALQARRRVFVILQVITEQFGHADRGLQRPVAVRINTQRVTGEGLFQRLDARHLMLGRQGAGLELDALEAVGLDHPPRLGNDLLFGQGLAPTVGLVG